MDLPSHIVCELQMVLKRMGLPTDDDHVLGLFVLCMPLKLDAVLISNVKQNARMIRDLDEAIKRAQNRAKKGGEI